MEEEKIDIEPREKLLTHRLNDVLQVLSQFETSKSLYKSTIYKGIKKDLDKVLYGLEYGNYAEGIPDLSRKEFLRVVFWNLEGEYCYEAILENLKSHPILSKGDVFLFTNADIGMSRTSNRNIMRSLAIELFYNYVFCCSYIHLPKSEDPKLKNQFGLVGNAILTKHQISNHKILSLPNTTDTLKVGNPRIGNEKVLITDLNLGKKDFILKILTHQLDVYSSQKQRVNQMKMIFDSIRGHLAGRPVFCGANLDTTTYDTRTPWNYKMSLLNKVLRGIDYIFEEHHPFPERYFDKDLFQKIINNQYSYEDFNSLGEFTWQKYFHEDQKFVGANDKFYSWLMKFIHKKIKLDHFSLKTDWFYGNEQIRRSSSPHALRPKIVNNLSRAGHNIHTHYPIVVDIEALHEKKEI